MSAFQQICMSIDHKDRYLLKDRNPSRVFVFKNRKFWQQLKSPTIITAVISMAILNLEK